ncbi:MAG: NAD(P)-dependent oxidoreductase [Chloroflexi bacterium]|jgi:predicted homoserine dehydrogenase-like protein|nr:NAD(P)-dependent oxidoreductase [Chloroflexota bacterium]
MFGIRNDLLRLEEQGKQIRVGIIGAGQMGRGMVAQIVSMNGMIPGIVVDIQRDNAKKALLNAGIPIENIKVANNVSEANNYVAQGHYVITDNANIAIETDAIDVIVDATGVTEVGAKLAVDTINAHKHIVMLNVETDVVIGPLLSRMARREGVIYSGSAGDEPGAVMELYDFAAALGFEVLVIGKGKNNKVDKDTTPDSCFEEAQSKHMNPKMLTSFKDGTKTMVEMTAMSNATGFLPDVVGGHGRHAGVSDLASMYRLKNEGGILNTYQVVDYVNGVAPGVFIIITSKFPEVHDELRYLSMGDGPNYVLFRPYHLTSLETPMSVARIMLHNEPTIIPIAGAPYAEATTIAKKDMKAGEYLDGLGAYTVYASFHSYSEAKALNALPIGLVNGKTRLKEDVKKGQLITYQMVDLAEDSYILKLRKEQDALQAQGSL